MGTLQINKYDQGFPLFSISTVIFSHHDDKSERLGATLSFLPLSSMSRNDTCKFHGSFRILYMQYYSFPNLPYRYFNKCLVLYIIFLISRQTSLIEVPLYFVVFHTTNINRLFSHYERLLFTSHKHLAFDFFMMIHHTTLLTTLSSSLSKSLLTESLLLSSIPKSL